jgi:hypothetical protein
LLSLLPGESVGAVVSWTVAVNEPLAVLPWLSLTEQLTVVTPMGKVEPEAGPHDGVRAPSTTSCPDTRKETPRGPSGSAEPDAGMHSTARVPSTRSLASGGV